MLDILYWQENTNYYQYFSLQNQRTSFPLLASHCIKYFFELNDSLRNLSNTNRPSIRELSYKFFFY